MKGAKAKMTKQMTAPERVHEETSCRHFLSMEPVSRLEFVFRSVLAVSDTCVHVFNRKQHHTQHNTQLGTTVFSRREQRHDQVTSSPRNPTQIRVERYRSKKLDEPRRGRDYISAVGQMPDIKNGKTHTKNNPAKFHARK